MKRERVVLRALGAAALLALAGCGKASEAPARSHAEETAAPVSSTATAEREDMRDRPVPVVNGEPLWAANKRHTAEENAAYHFKRDGADFGAATQDDYVAKAHAFIDKPPSDALTLARKNGDKLIYDPKANIFAVSTKDGAPRTMFKPKDGASYWDKVKQREAQQDAKRGKDDDQSG